MSLQCKYGNCAVVPADVDLVDNAPRLCAVCPGSARHFAQQLAAPYFLKAAT
jgi:hypothetical protein